PCPRFQLSAPGGGRLLCAVARTPPARSVTAPKRDYLPLPARFAAFVFVGGLCLAANSLALWLLTSGLGVHYLVSTVIAFTSITPLGFLLHKVLTFDTRRAYARVELPLFFTSMAATFGMILAII